MKINWGVGIAMLYVGFVVMILGLVAMSATQKIDLVTEHYYEEELRFQDKIEKIKRTAALTYPLAWEVSNTGIRISFPKNLQENAVFGNVKLYCPADEKNDRSFVISSKTQEQLISTYSIPEGNYRLQIDWKTGDQTYWNEDVIVISRSN